jgi:hypothetical protein
VSVKVFNPAKQQWGDYPYLDKVVRGETVKKFEDVAYAQGALNFLGIQDLTGKPLLIDGQFGKKTKSAVQQFQVKNKLLMTGVLDAATWDLLDYASFNEWEPAPKRLWRAIPIPYGTAITVGGKNRHTGQPVDKHGLTREACRLMTAIQVNFPKGPTKQNYAVDRNQGHKANAPLSDHARGEAVDMMIPGYDGNKANISADDTSYGRSVMAWIVDHSQGPLGRGLRGKTFRGKYRVSYVLFNGWIWYASEDAWPDATDPLSDGWVDSDAEWMAWAVKNEVRRLKPGTDQHKNHVHCSIVPVDRR